MKYNSSMENRVDANERNIQIQNELKDSFILKKLLISEGMIITYQKSAYHKKAYKIQTINTRVL